jgi:pyruvate dehydrogenase E2 component (dihydrolipoyllysine-residue acetyltransferase)
VQHVNIPSLGMAMTEAVLTRWHKQPGDSVAAGEVIADIETDKSVVDLESPAEGVLGRHLVAEGEVVPVGAPVVRVLGPGESEEAPETPEQRDATADPASPVEPPVAPVAAPPPPVSDGTPDPDVGGGSGPRRYSPPPRTPHAQSPRRRRLERLEAEAAAFHALTGEGGPTQAREAASASLIASPAAPPSASSGTSAAGDASPYVPAPPLAPTSMPRATPPARSSGRYRTAVADRVARSWREIPHFMVQREVDAGEADSALAAVRTRDPDATWTDLLLHAYALALREAASDSVGDVGLAVATPDGVLLPVVAGVPALDVSSLVTARTAAVRRAREGKLSAHDLASVPVGSLSNLGALGVDAFTGIIPFQQQVLLTIGRVRARPAVVDGRLAVRTTVVATLNVDHRDVDGDQAARVLMAFERSLAGVRAWAEGASS